jgi:hypothetical protein
VASIDRFWRVLRVLRVLDCLFCEICEICECCEYCECWIVGLLDCFASLRVLDCSPCNHMRPGAATRVTTHTHTRHHSESATRFISPRKSRERRSSREPGFENLTGIRWYYWPVLAGIIGQ